MQLDFAQRLVVACGAALAAGLTPRIAFAEGTPCDRVLVEVSAPLDASWLAEVARLRAQVASLPSDECSATTLALVLRGGRVVLRASAPDGRVGEREVGDPSALTSIALGLLAAIPVETAPPPPEPSPPAVPIGIDPT